MARRSVGARRAGLRCTARAARARDRDKPPALSRRSWPCSGNAQTRPSCWSTSAAHQRCFNSVRSRRGGGSDAPTRGRSLCSTAVHCMTKDDALAVPPLSHPDIIVGNGTRPALVVLTRAQAWAAATLDCASPSTPPRAGLTTPAAARRDAAVRRRHTRLRQALSDARPDRAVAPPLPRAHGATRDPRASPTHALTLSELMATGLDHRDDDDEDSTAGTGAARPAAAVTAARAVPSAVIEDCSEGLLAALRALGALTPATRSQLQHRGASGAAGRSQRGRVCRDQLLGPDPTHRRLPARRSG